MVAARKTRQTDRSCMRNGRKQLGVGTDACGRTPRQFQGRLDSGNLDSNLTQVLRGRATVRGHCVVNVLLRPPCAAGGARLARSDVTTSVTFLIFAVQVWRSRGAASHLN